MTTRFLVLFSFVGLLTFSSFDFVSFGEKHDDSSDSFFAVGDEFYKWQNLQTGETITIEGTLTAIIVEGLGAILIVAFIIIYAIKRRRSK